MANLMQKIFGKKDRETIQNVPVDYITEEKEKLKIEERERREQEMIAEAKERRLKKIVEEKGIRLARKNFIREEAKLINNYGRKVNDKFPTLCKYVVKHTNQMQDRPTLDREAKIGRALDRVLTQGIHVENGRISEYGPFANYDYIFNPIAYKIKDLVHERDSKIKDVEGFTNTHYSKKMGKNPFGEGTRVFLGIDNLLTPETLHVKRMGVIAEYDPKINNLVMEMENIVDGLYHMKETAQRLEDNDRTIGKDDYQNLRRQLRILAGEAKC